MDLALLLKETERANFHRQYMLAIYIHVSIQKMSNIYVILAEKC